MLLHERDDYGDLIATLAGEMNIDPALVEKDYWIMHVLWGLQQLGLAFELKGGTSLSKGYGLIHRFSEDIDILIHPPEGTPTGRRQTKSAHVEARRAFFDGLAVELSIPGVVEVLRDRNFERPRVRYDILRDRRRFYDKSLLRVDNPDVRLARSSPSLRHGSLSRCT